MRWILCIYIFFIFLFFIDNLYFGQLIRAAIVFNNKCFFILSFSEITLIISIEI